jgi:hypothetical protein
VSNDLFDPPAPILRERDLAARREHLLRELERTHGRPLRRLGRRTALAVVLAALIVALAAALPGRIGRNQMTLIDRAIAAIGNGPTTHVVLDEELGRRLVDFRTGKTTLVRTRVEIWSDPKLGMLELSTLDGKPLQTVFLPPSQSASASDSLRTLVAGYRAQLRNGAYHVIGSGKVAGQPIDWIASTPQPIRDPLSGVLREMVQEVAISRTTYKPLYMRLRVDGVIRADSGRRVMTAETLPHRPALFAHRRPVLAGYSYGLSGPPTTLAQARAAMNPDPIVPPKRLASLRRTWIGLTRYLKDPASSFRDQIGGVELFYGRTDYAGAPTYSGSFISITEFPRRNPVVAYEGIALFRQDAAIITNSTATMKTHGLYVIIEAGSPAEALAAARALARVR